MSATARLASILGLAMVAACGTPRAPSSLPRTSSVRTTSNGGDPQCNDGGGCGTVFKLSANGGKWTEHILHVFEDDPTDGGMPGSALLLEPSGDLFGTTEFGGPGPGIGEGSVFEIRR